MAGLRGGSGVELFWLFARVRQAPAVTPAQWLKGTRWEGCPYHVTWGSVPEERRRFLSARPCGVLASCKAAAARVLSAPFTVRLKKMSRQDPMLLFGGGGCSFHLVSVDFSRGPGPRGLSRERRRAAGGVPQP